MTIPKWVKVYAKSIAAFAATFVGNMIVSLANGTTAIPQTKHEWSQYLLTSALAFVATFFTRNKITQKQLDQDEHVVGGIVIDTPPQSKPPTSFQAPQEGYTFPAEGGYPNPFG